MCTRRSPAQTCQQSFWATDTRSHTKNDEHTHKHMPQVSAQDACAATTEKSDGSRCAVCGGTTQNQGRHDICWRAVSWVGADQKIASSNTKLRCELRAAVNLVCMCMCFEMQTSSFAWPCIFFRASASEKQSTTHKIDECATRMTRVTN